MTRNDLQEGGDGVILRDGRAGRDGDGDDDDDGRRERDRRRDKAGSLLPFSVRLIHLISTLR